MSETSGASLDDVLAPAGVAWTVVGDGVIVHQPTTGTTFALDGTAAVLWRCLDEVSPLRTVYADIAEAFGADERVVADGSAPALSSWVAAGLVGPPPSARRHPTTVTAHGRTWRRLADPPDA